MGTIRIDSPDDERLSEFRNVPDPLLLARLGLFVAEGRLVVTRLLESGLETRALLVTESALTSLSEWLAAPSFPVYVVPPGGDGWCGGFQLSSRLSGDRRATASAQLA